MLCLSRFRVVGLSSKYYALAVCTCVLFLSPITLGTEVYKWVDENGVVTYSQEKPKHTDSRKINTIGAPPSAELAQLSAQKKPAAVTELTAEQQQTLEKLESDSVKRIAEETAKKASNCEIFTKYLAQLMSKDRIRAREPDGSERMVPEDERQERIAAAKKEIELNCS